jgi:amino acid adenylation domain-containing protein
MLAHNNAGVQEQFLDMGGVEVRRYVEGDEINRSVFDLVLMLIESGDNLEGSLMYNTDLFEGTSAWRMVDNFIHLVEQVANDPDLDVGEINALESPQYETVVYTFNVTHRPFPPLTLQQMFEEGAARHPDKTAVVSLEESGWSQEHGAGHISYRLLNQRANRLAHYLRETHGVKPGCVIGVTLERSFDMVIVLLGIIKAGGAYLAVDPTYPRERLLHVLSDSNCKQLIIDKMRPQLFKGYHGEIIDVSDGWDIISRQPGENPGCLNQPSDPLYVNYTSGSTGTPNGALLSHDCLTNLIQWQNRVTAIDCSLKCLQFTSINFCVSFQELMGTLTSGGQVHLIGDIERQDIEYLMDFLDRHRVEILFLPFSYLNFLFNESDRWNRSFRHNLKHIITAGEQLKITAGLKRFLEANPHLQVHNHYGSTEMHVVTSYTLDASTAAQTSIPPAGKPISNVSIYILDQDLNPVPVGVWGELFVKGSSQVLGYINNDALTNEKLVFHPQLSSRDNIKLYRSGDIGRWMPDGNIELRGRKDSMVKVRGFRVEPGEIESRILAIPQVRECVVLVKEDENKQKDLLAYVSVEGISAGEIKLIISGGLPNYMIPTFVILDALPLMPNGKVDRERLPHPGTMASGRDTTLDIDPTRVTAFYRQGKTLDRIDEKALVLDTGYLERALGTYTRLLEQTFLHKNLEVTHIDVNYVNYTAAEKEQPVHEPMEPFLTPPRAQITDYALIPIPDRSLISHRRYNKRIGLASAKHTISLQATRGCPYKCLYCHKIWPKNHVYRPAENLYEEIEMYYAMGVRRFVFVDDIFNLNRENSTRFFKMIIQNGLDIHMFFSNGLRSDLLTPEYIDLMVEAGTVSLALALETASPRLQKLLRKNMNLDKLRKSLEYFCSTYPHVVLELFLMHGFPTETEAEANITLDFLKALKWVDFPYLNLLKIYPNTDMAEMAMEKGITAEAIARSSQMGYHELPQTLPFDKSFTRAYQTDFLNNYFLCKERLLAKLPRQMNLFSESEMVQKYNGYLPTEITSFEGLLDVAGIKREQLAVKQCVPESHFAVPDLDAKIRVRFPVKETVERPFKILLLDLSTYFSSEKDILYDEVEPPLGLMYVYTYLRGQLGNKVECRIAKSRVDFDGFKQLKDLIEEFEPHLIGIRTLTYYANFFHNTVAMIRHWGVAAPIVTGGPYATSEFRQILRDPNIDLVVLSEGELIFCDLVERCIANNYKLPPDDELKTIAGLAFIPGEKRPDRETGRPTLGTEAMIGSLFTRLEDDPAPVSLWGWGVVRVPLHLRTQSIYSIDMVADTSAPAADNTNIPVMLRMTVPEGRFSAAGQTVNVAPPTNETEKKLRAIWSELLGIDAHLIGIDANFFEMGGHSLKATTMMARVHKEFGVKIKLNEIFKYPTLKEIAALISTTHETPFSELETAAPKEYYDLSYNQRRLWVTLQLEPDSAAYNMPEWIDLKERIDDDPFGKILYRVMERHESLRTGFKTLEGSNTPVQFVVPADQVEIPLKRVDLSSLTGDEKQRQMDQYFVHESAAPFDLTRPPLFRCTVLKVAVGHYRIVLNMHHIITDGASQEILRKEFITLYEAYTRGKLAELPDVPFQYKDFAVWQANQLKNPAVKEWAYNFWKQTLEKDLRPVALPVDAGGDPTDRTGAAYRCVLPEAAKDRLNRLAKDNNTSLFTALLALFDILLSRVSGQQDILLGIPVSGRDHASLQHVVGFFVNTLVLDTHVDENTPFVQFLGTVNAHLLDVLQHQGCPLEIVCEDLNMTFPRINVFFNMFNLDDSKPQTLLDSLEPYHSEEGNEVKFDFILYLLEYKNGIDLRCNYKKSLFSPAAVESIMERCLKVIDFFSANPAKNILDYLRATSPVEKRTFKRN